jgi:5-methylcytosine-specific restriction endonuclease McrA
MQAKAAGATNANGHTTSEWSSLMDSDMVPRMRRCTKCGNEFPATAEFFHKNPQQKSGLNPTCKACKNAFQRARYVNDEYHKERTRKWREQNREKAAGHTRKYRTTDKGKAAMKAAYDTEYNRRRMAQWRRANPEKARAAHLRVRHAGMGTVSAMDIATQHARQNGRCYYCGENLDEKYHVDHVIPVSRGGLNEPSNIVLACPFCNVSKGARLPHEWPRGGRLL